MTNLITLTKEATVTAQGKHNNKTCTPIICINTKTNTKTVYTSIVDAARELEVNPQSISDMLRGRRAHVKGNRFIRLSDVVEHLDEIMFSSNTSELEAKAKAYDAIMARKAEISKANEELRRNKEAYSRLSQELTEMQAHITEIENKLVELEREEEEVA